jgi:MoxR-like ATPase
MNDWWIYQGLGTPHSGIARLPAPPPWRDFDGGPPLPNPGPDDPITRRRLGLRGAESYQPRHEELEMVNTALYLRRPLLVTGRPGIGKSTLAYAAAHELALGPVLRWPITSRSTLQEGLYTYDPLARLQDANLAAHQGTAAPDIGRYLTLGPLGTALLPYARPRVLLVDEIDKSDIDLPNDLLNIFEVGEYVIPELQRAMQNHPTVDVAVTGSRDLASIVDGVVTCLSFPLVIMTSNGERDFPPAFLRRCLRLDLRPPSAAMLTKIVEAHFGVPQRAANVDLIDAFLVAQQDGLLATDQLLNAIYLTSQVAAEPGLERDQLTELLLRRLEPDPDLE